METSTFFCNYTTRSLLFLLQHWHYNLQNIFIVLLCLIFCPPVNYSSLFAFYYFFWHFICKIGSKYKLLKFLDFYGFSAAIPYIYSCNVFNFVLKLFGLYFWACITGLNIFLFRSPKIFLHFEDFFTVLFNISW